MIDWLYDEEEILRIHLLSEKREAKKEGIKESAVKMLKKGRVELEELSEMFPELTEEDIKEIEAEVFNVVK